MELFELNREEKSNIDIFIEQIDSGVVKKPKSLIKVGNIKSKEKKSKKKGKKSIKKGKKSKKEKKLKKEKL